MGERLYGHHPLRVVELLRNRKHSGWRAGGHGDRKLALIVEGGGMRGVLSAGSLLAVDLLGYRACFDEIYATSSGAVNAAFFLSGQGSSGIRVYFDDINNRHFYNPCRLFKIVDVDYVYDYVVPQVKKLDERVLKNSATDLLFSMTEVNSGKNVLKSVKSSRETVAKMLKASSALPVLYNKTVTLDGEQYVDGGISCTVPIRQAIDNGCTDILVLVTKPHGYIPSAPSAFERSMMRIMMGWRFPNVAKTFSGKADTALENRLIAAGDTVIDGVNVATVFPSQQELIVGRTTVDRNRLIRGAELMARKTFRLFNEDPCDLNGVFEAYYKNQ